MRAMKDTATHVRGKMLALFEAFARRYWFCLVGPWPWDLSISLAASKGHVWGGNAVLNRHSRGSDKSTINQSKD